MRVSSIAYFHCIKVLYSISVMSILLLTCGIVVQVKTDKFDIHLVGFDAKRFHAQLIGVMSHFIFFHELHEPGFNKKDFHLSSFIIDDYMEIFYSLNKLIISAF